MYKTRPLKPPVFYDGADDKIYKNYEIFGNICISILDSPHIEQSHFLKQDKSFRKESKYEEMLPISDDREN